MAEVTTITIGADEFYIYGTLAAAETYANGRYGPAYTAWLAADPDDQARTLVAAADLIDAETWSATKSEDDQPREWPRSGVTDEYGNEIDDTTVPSRIEHAEYELAIMLYSNPALADAGTADKNVKRVEAKGASVEFFGPQRLGRFPSKVQKLIGVFLASTSSTAGQAEISGESDCTQFDDADRFDLSDGL